MEDCPGSPEIDVVSDGDKSKRCHHRSEQFYSEATSQGKNSNSLSFRATNESGANLLAANTNIAAKQRAETVNLRVRNMGIINVKNEPESDEGDESSYSLSALLEECDFNKTPRRNKRPMSPTLSKTTTTKPVESSRPGGTVQGRSRQSLENVISSLKSARTVNINKPKPTNGPSNTVSAPIQVTSPPKISGHQSSAPVNGSVPQIVDVRSLASVARPTPVTHSLKQMLRSSLNTGPQQRCTNSLSSTTTTHTPGTRERVPGATQTATPIAPGVNIRFVLPPNVPFNTDQFQLVLQATLASLSAQSRMVEPDQLQKAIQAALLSVTKSTVAFNPSQLQQAIHNSLASACGLSVVPQAAQKPLTPQAVYFPQTTQRQLQTIAPKPPSLQVQPQVTSGNTTIVTFENKLTSTTSSTCSTNVTASRQPATKTTGNTPVVNGNSNYQLTSKAPVSSSHLTSARDALIKALQENRVLNRPASLSSATVSSPSSVTDSNTIPVSFDDISISVSPASFPVASLAEAPASNSRVNDRSSSATPASITCTSSVKSTTPSATDTCTLSASASDSTPQTERGTAASMTSIGSALQAERASPLKSTSPPTRRVASAVMSADSAPQAEESTCTSVTPVVSTPQATGATPSVASAGSSTQATSVTTEGSAAQATGVSTSATTTESATPAAKGIPSLTTAGSAVQGTSVSASDTIAGSATPAARVSPSAASVGSIPQGGRVALTVTSTGSTSSPVIRSSPFIVIDPQTNQGKSSLPSISQTSLLSVSAPLSSHKTSPGTFSNINLRISLPANLASTSMNTTEKTTAALKKPPPSGCGCCPNCRLSHLESDDLYMCYFKGCGSVYSKESGLRKHHYFYPNHKPRIPLERASHSVEYFLPDDLNALHRTARLRELFKRLTEEEIKEHVLPHLSKTVSLFELLEIKSMRASTYRGKPNISAFKMFGEFERFRKEVENKLMALISLPQGRGRTTVGQKEEEKLSTTAKEANTAETAKQGKKDVPPPVTISDDQKTKSSTCQKKTTPSFSSASSETSKETTETFCVQSEAERIAVSSVETPDKAASSSIEDLPGQGSVSSDVIKNIVKEASDSSSKEKKTEESDQESTESGAAQSSNKEGSKVAGSTVQPEQSSKSVASSSGLSAVKDAVPLPMETDVRQIKDVRESGREPSTTQSTDVVMVEAEEKMESSSKRNPNISQECVIDVDKDTEESTGEKKQSSVRSSEGGSQEQARKQPTVVIEENKVEVDEIGEKHSPSVEKGDGKSLEAGKDTDKMASDFIGESGPTKSKENGGLQAKSNEKPSEATTHEKSQVDEKTSSTTKEPLSSNSSNSGDGSLDVQKETQQEASSLKQKFSRMLADITADEEEDIDESNLLEFGLPFAIKWGKVIKNARFLEVKKIVRKESYSEHDMRQFIYSKPKEAASVVISSDCHAHPSFFRAYVMPALLDKHIDNFGLFGKKILSRLYLSKQKYVDVLRSGIGPEFAKILGINLFPTFKRIQDTWRSVKTMTPEEKIKRNLVLVPMAEDESEVPEDEDERPPATNTANGMVTTSAVQGQGVTVQNPTIRAVGKHVQNTSTSIRPVGCTVQNSAVGVVGSTVQSATGSGNNLLKRPSPAAIAVQNNNSKKQKVDNSDAQKDSSRANKAQTVSSETGASQSNDAEKRQKADDMGNLTKNSSKDKSQLDGKSNSKPNQDGSAEKEKETTAPSGKSTTTESKTRSGRSSSVPQEEAAAGGSKGPTVHSSSSSQKKPSTNSDHAYSKQPNTTNAACLIPKKATIYTSSGKQGTSPLPFSTAKGSPLYLVPVEKLSPKLVEQFINQAKGDGVKTRSASSANKGTQPKQGSQVFILVPSASPNGSPTIHTLTSEEQLKGDGDKKPLLLLPADKVPKSMASQSPSARRKMLITMVSPSCLSGSAALSAAQSVTTTSSSSTGSEQNVSSATGQAAQGTIMSARESNTGSEVAVPNSAAVCEVTSENRASNDPKPSKESADSSVTTLVSVANNTSVLNSSTKDTLAERVNTDVSVGPVDAGETGLARLKEATATSDSDKLIGPKQNSELTNTSKSAGATDSSSELDILPSLLPSDFTLDNVLKDITGDGSASGANEMLPLDVSEIVISCEDLPVESDSHTATGMSCDAVTAPSDGVACDSDSDARSSREGREGSAMEDDHRTSFRRQSPRKALTKSTPLSSLTDVSSPNSSGGSRENSDVEDGSPARKRRKTPTRISTRTSSQVTFVPDKEVPGKSTYGSPSKSKGRKQ